MILARIATVTVAMLVCAWFALGVEQAQDTQGASAILNAGSPLTGARARSADALLSSAGWLNPDTEVDVLRARLALATGHAARAARIMVGVTRSEPMNVLAWVELAASTTRGPEFREAIARIGQLNALP